MTIWRLKSLKINETIRAHDQWIAWDSLRSKPITDFGLIVTAEDTKDASNEYGVKTSQLMGRWGRDDDAYTFICAAIDAGLPV